MKMLTVILDIDETIVYSREKKSFPGCTSFTDDYWGVTHTILRPGTKEFLETLEERKYKIISLTQGVVPFQKLVLERLGVIDFFEEIYGWKTTSRVEATKPNLTNQKWVLLDNLSHLELWEKQYWLQEELFPYENFIKVQPYYGLPEVLPLSHYLGDISRILEKI